MAVLARASSALQQMIEYGCRNGIPQPHQVDVASRDALGCTPLHVAAYVGHAESCKVLLRFGASAMQPDNGGVHTLKTRVPFLVIVPPDYNCRVQGVSSCVLHCEGSHEPPCCTENSSSLEIQSSRQANVVA
jgi:ankyrin repeat protein